MSRPRLRSPEENRIWRAYVRATWEKQTRRAGRCVGCGKRTTSSTRTATSPSRQQPRSRKATPVSETAPSRAPRESQ